MKIVLPRIIRHLPRFLLLCLCTAGAAGQSAPQETLRQEIIKALDAPELASGWQGVVIQSVKEKSPLFERNPNRLFMPASNTKLLTSIAALKILGKDFAFVTRIAHDGTRRGDRIDGNLYLVGGGDPLLTTNHLSKLANALKEMGIRRVAGSVVPDTRHFDNVAYGFGWSWDDEPFYYQAQVSALNLNSNVISVTASPSETLGNPATVTLLTPKGYFGIENASRTVAKGVPNTLRIERKRAQNTLLLTGDLPQETKPVRTEVTLENPAEYAAQVFARILREEAHIQVRQERRKSIKRLPASLTPLTELRSETLPEILKRLNKPSDNLVAEALCKEIGATSKGAGSWERGVAAIREALLKMGCDPKGLSQEDGSGLSRFNLVSPQNFVRLLIAIEAAPEFDFLYDSLPIAGVDGTLRNRMKDSAATNNCRAKTGSLGNVSSICGYVSSKEGERFVFSIMMNHTLSSVASRAAQDKIITLLAQYSQNPKTEQGKP